MNFYIKMLGGDHVMEINTANIQTGLEKYLHIMHRLHQTDVSQDLEFQRSYNGFYRMRQRPESYYTTYFSFLESHKSDPDLTFRQVLTYLYRKTERIEASFSSKLLATVKPEMPVWDTFVLQNLGLTPPPAYYSKANRIEAIITLYNSICQWYSSQEAQEKLEFFNFYFPSVNITDTKKIDLILWQSR